MYRKFMIFKVFGVYLIEFLIFLHEIFFGSTILLSSCDKYQKFDYGCYPGNEAQKSRFWPFFDDFEYFCAVWLGTCKPLA